ncbi:hypothetical protein QFZ78_005418 [Paenibacillus sp. V4I5]|nr:hypothetical protein [Paenibacillus sp. V4I5]
MVSTLSLTKYGPLDEDTSLLDLVSNVQNKFIEYVIQKVKDRLKLRLLLSK